MPASIVKFGSFVQSCALWVEEDEKFFKKTTPAFASCRVEETSILNLFPIDVVVDIPVFQQPNVLAEGCTLVLAWVIRIWPVSVKTTTPAFVVICRLSRSRKRQA